MKLDKRTIFYILLIIALWLSIYRYSIPTPGSYYSAVPIIPEERFRNLSNARCALSAILYLNTILDEDDRVYGIWLEDHRLYADFQLVGTIYGWKNHFEFAREHRRSAFRTWLFLRDIDCEYLLYSETRYVRLNKYINMKFPIHHWYDWESFFEPVLTGEDPPELYLWRVRPEPVPVDEILTRFPHAFDEAVEPEEEIDG